MQRMRRQNLNSINRRIIQHRPVVGVSLLRAPLCGTGFGDTWAVIGDRVDSGVRVGEIAGNV